MEKSIQLFKKPLRERTLKKIPQGIFHRAGDYVREEYFRNRIVYISIMIALLPLTFGQIHFLYYLIVPWLQRSVLEISKWPWEEITRAHGLISSRDGKKKKFKNSNNRNNSSTLQGHDANGK